MNDRDLYRKILGITPPWSVENVELSTAKREVVIHLANLERQLPCPECGKECRRHDGRSRRWRHLDTCQFATILVAEVPRISCEEHGVLQVRVPWAEPGSGFTALFEAFDINWLKVASLSAVAELCGLSWKAVDDIQQRAVARGLQRRQPHLPQRLGICAGRGREARTPYLCRPCGPGSLEFVFGAPFESGAAWSLPRRRSSSISFSNFSSWRVCLSKRRQPLHLTQERRVLHSQSLSRSQDIAHDGG